MKGTVMSARSISQTDRGEEVVTVTTGEGARQRLIDLQLAIELIEVSLESGGRIDADGHPVTEEAHQEWRHRAKRALAFRKAQIREMTLWMKMRDKALPLVREDGGLHNARDVMEAARVIIKEAAAGMVPDKARAYAVTDRLEALMKFRDKYGESY